MSTIGPYHLVQQLGSCPVGTVWGGVDPAGHRATVAILHAAVAHDGQWRQAFEAAGRALAASATIRVTAADMTATTPWIACAAEGGSAAEVFVALGQPYQPVPGESYQPVPGEPRDEAPSSGMPELTDPSSGAPASGGATGWPQSPAGAAPAVAGIRPGRLVAVILLILLLPVGGSLIIAGTAHPEAAPTTTTPTPRSGSPSPFSTPPPSSPGVEPPRSGDWPGNFPAFASDEPTKVVTPSGFGFSFRVPASWTCGATKRSADGDRIACSDPAGGGLAGGDLLSRRCPQPCNAARQTQLRQAEEAFGLRWVQASAFTSFAETNQVLGAARYGLVFVTFWRTTPDGPLDRELVFRMTAPLERTSDIRKIATSVRHAVI